MSKHCPCCGEEGTNVPETQGGRLLACMELDCRVNEFIDERDIIIEK